MGRLANGPRGWIGVDLDRTLAQREHDGGDNTPGEPVPAMVARVKRWLSQGKNVRIFTARVAPGIVEPGWTPAEEQTAIVEAWCLKHIGQILPVTCMKDYYMKEMWDDCAVAVEENTGRQLSPSKVDGPPTPTSGPGSVEPLSTTERQRPGGLADWDLVPGLSI